MIKHYPVVDLDRSIIERRCGDWTEGRYAWKLGNTQAVEPFPFLGSQSIRDLPVEVVSKLRPASPLYP
jgi:hypothetical protein